jgi:hypothetical protein
MDYKVKKEDNQFKVIETKTDKIIYQSDDEKKARELARKWNLGGGFSGWTPTFFLDEHKFQPQTD